MQVAAIKSASTPLPAKFRHWIVSSLVASLPAFCSHSCLNDRAGSFYIALILPNIIKLLVYVCFSFDKSVPSRIGTVALPFNMLFLSRVIALC